MGTFDGKVAIVTGGAQGMGRATALAFAQEGASVTVADIHKEAGNSIVSEIGDAGSRGLFVDADVSDASQCRRVVEQTVAAFGGLDILFNNVGVQPPHSYVNVEETSEELWDKILGVNLRSHFLMAKYAIPEMRRRGGGAIVNNASVQGLQSQKLVPAYAASKGGILSLTRQLALDYAAENIRVLAICPGAVDTELVRTVASMEPGDVDETIERWGRGSPLGRIGAGRDIANVVLFLASEKASYMTGEHVVVDGGLMALGAWGGMAGAAAADWS